MSHFSKYICHFLVENEYGDDHKQISTQIISRD